MAEDAPNRPAKPRVEDHAQFNRATPDLVKNMTPHTGKLLVTEKLSTLASKHLIKLQTNVDLADCCRNPIAHMIQYFRSIPELPGADFMVMTCNCGKNHYTMASSGEKKKQTA